MARKRRGRISLRTDEELLEEIKRYAERKRLTLTVIIEQHFQDLLEREKRVTTEAPQI